MQRDVWHHRTMFIPVAFDLSAYNKTGRERIMYMCVKSIEFAVYTILLLDLKMFRHYHWVDTSAGGLLVAEYITRGVFNIVAARLSYVEKSHCTKASLAAI